MYFNARYVNISLAVVMPRTYDIIPDKKSGTCLAWDIVGKFLFIARTAAKCADALNINEARYEGWLARDRSFQRLRGPDNPEARLQHPVIISSDLRVAPFENRVSLYAKFCRTAGLWFTDARRRGLLLRPSHASSIKATRNAVTIITR